MAALLVGKSYPELKHVLPSLTNSGARQAERAIEKARRRAHEKWKIEDDNRLIVEKAWVGRGEMAPRLRIHGRGKTVSVNVSRVVWFIVSQFAPGNYASALGKDVG